MQMNSFRVSALTLIAMCFFTAITLGQDFSSYNEQVVASWRASGQLKIGSIKIVNNYVAGRSGQVDIQLFHPDALRQVFATWTITGGAETMLATNNNNVVIGSDWGIRILFGSGVVSKIYAVGQVGQYVGNQHIVKATDIYEGRTFNQAGSSTSSSATAANFSLASGEFAPLGDRYITFRSGNRSFALRMGAAMLSDLISNQPEQRVKWTNYNRLTAKWFKYKGVDVRGQQLLISFRGRYVKLEDRPLIGGRFTVYDNAADVDVGVNLAIENGFVAQILSCFFQP